MRREPRLTCFSLSADFLLLNEASCEHHPLQRFQCACLLLPEPHAADRLLYVSARGALRDRFKLLWIVVCDSPFAGVPNSKGCTLTFCCHSQNWRELHYYAKRAWLGGTFLSKDIQSKKFLSASMCRFHRLFITVHIEHSSQTFKHAVRMYECVCLLSLRRQSNSVMLFGSKGERKALFVQGGGAGGGGVRISLKYRLSHHSNSPHPFSALLSPSSSLYFSLFSLLHSHLLFFFFLFSSVVGWGGRADQGGKNVDASKWRRKEWQRGNANQLKTQLLIWQLK